MTDMVIPPEAVEAAAKAIYEAPHDGLSRQGYDRASRDIQDLYRAEATAALEAALPHLHPTACTCPTDADVTPDMRSETGQHLSGCPFAAEGLGAWMDEQIERINETKALVETATRLGRELGRREAGEEIAAKADGIGSEYQDSAVAHRDLAGDKSTGKQMLHHRTAIAYRNKADGAWAVAAAAREIATKEPK